MLSVYRRLGLFILVATCAVGCASQRTVAAVPEANGLPDHFLVGSHQNASVRQEPQPGEGCRNPLVDPQDGSRLLLVRSTSSEGDYEVADGRYGIGRRSLLRVDCATGKPLGVVPR